ncbi:transposase [Halostreptopolyspora alba]|uniref:Mutator family transposase n=1 Tax=Halostreptopolyspora alba TaxID=2487137 RepID=A0A3N0E2U9_9ACTN|nr:hypothetical protein EFW17_20440 [Nocardiopsaceae bacterium YIM 96095]
MAFTPAVRRLLYTTNSIESLNHQLRKVTKVRGHLPSDEAAVKLLWLAIINIEDKRARERPTPRHPPPPKAARPNASSKANAHQAGNRSSPNSTRPTQDESNKETQNRTTYTLEVTGSRPNQCQACPET